MWSFDSQRNHIPTETGLHHQIAKRSNFGTALGVSAEVQRASGGHENSTNAAQFAFSEIP